MKNVPPLRLGNLQLQILSVLWRLGPSSVADVHQALIDQQLAYTTVATMLRKMEDRGLVRHTEEGRRFIYSAAVSGEQVRRSMSGDLVDRLFGGSLSAAISHLLEARDISPDELSELERLIQQRRQTKGQQR